MSKIKKIMILDVEGLSTCKPYNIGWVVGDRHGNIYAEESMAIVPCIWENLKSCLKTQGHTQKMTHENIQEILLNFANSLNNRKYIYYNIEEAKKKLLNVIIENNISEIWAYNAAFDKASLRRLFANDWDKLDNLVNFYDIVSAILYTKLLTKKYVQFCNKNGFITSKGNVMTTAEIVYKYLTDDLTFQEEHTGLADCKIEYNILLEAIHTKQKITKKNVCAWIVFKKFCEAHNIETIIPLN